MLDEPATITAGGRTLTLRGTHELYLQWLRTGHANRGMVARVTKDLPPDALCLDVGANIGVMALSLAVHRPDCQIIAFEPIPVTAACLRENIRTNAISNVEVVEAAVGSCRGTLALTDVGPWSHVDVTGAVLAQVLPLDEFADRPVAFVKIDAEGYEPHVLAGAGELFARRKPLVLMEFNAYAATLHHHDPLVFAEAIFANFDVLAVYASDREVPLPLNGKGLLLENLLNHGCVTDLLLRPRCQMPDLLAMTQTPVARALACEVSALRNSTSWRITAPLRTLAAMVRR